MTTRYYELRHYMKWFRWPPYLTFGIVFIAFFAISWLTLDPDFGWHLTSGGYFLHHGIPATDIFTYSAAHYPWIDHEWGGDVLLYLLYQTGGYLLAACFYAGFWTLALFLIGRTLSGPIVVLACLAILPFAGVRAGIWTVVGLSACWAIIHLHDKRWRWLLIPLFFAWANLHGGFPAGFVYLAYVALRERSLKLVGVITAGLMVALCNPYGFQLYTEIGRTLGSQNLRGSITEWIPIGSVWQVAPYVAVWAASAVLVKGKRWRAYLSLDTFALATVLSGVRNYPLFVVLSLPATEQYVRKVYASLPHHLRTQQFRVLVAMSGVVGALFLWSGAMLYNLPPDREAFYPSQAVAYLQKQPCAGHVFNDFNYGGYLIWKLPSEKVFIDGRMPTWQLDGQNYLEEYKRILKDPAYRGREFARYDVRCVIVSYGDSNNKMITALAREGWKVVVRANGGVLLEK